MVRCSMGKREGMDVSDTTSGYSVARALWPNLAAGVSKSFSDW